MSIDDFSKKIDNALSFLNSSEMLQIGEVVGHDAAALITDRVVQTGKDSNGNDFSPYSTKKIAAFSYFGKSRTGSAEAQVRAKAKAKQPLSYRDFRQINNLNTDKKNFEFTGNMWRGFTVLKVERQGGRVVVILGGKTKDSANRLQYGSDKERQNIAEISADELNIIKDIMASRVMQRINL